MMSAIKREEQTMGMPRGLIKSTNYWNRVEAWKDWEKAASAAPELAKQFQPPADAGWRTIDKCIEKLREAVINKLYDNTINPDLPEDIQAMFKSMSVEAKLSGLQLYKEIHKS
jgi:hypothetical protein